MKRALSWLTICLCGSLTVGAYEVTLDPAVINQAIAIGLSRGQSDRERFHRQYRAQVDQGPVDWIDVITPFRRVVLAAESHTRDGGRLYGQRDAMAMLASAPQQLDVVAELTFHPLNTFVGVPPYDIELVGRDERIAPSDVERIPRFGPRVTGSPLPYPFGGTIRTPRGAEPLLGGIIAAHFDAGRVAEDGVYDIVVTDDGTELARTRVSFGTLR